MKLGRGKSKGNRFENLVGRLLSGWLTNGDDKTQLIPTRLSGGWMKSTAYRQAGDLAPNGPAGETFRRLFVVECKHHKKDLLWRLYTSESIDSIQGWWAQLEEEAERVGCNPMLVFRQNTRPIMVVLPTELAWYISAALENPVLFADRYGLMLLDNLLSMPIEEFYPLLDQTPKSVPHQ